MWHCASLFKPGIYPEINRCQDVDFSGWLHWGNHWRWRVREKCYWTSIEGVEEWKIITFPSRSPASAQYVLWRKCGCIHWTCYEKEKTYIFGAGHTGHALARLAVHLDFEIFVIDDRKDYLDQIQVEGVNKNAFYIMRRRSPFFRLMNKPLSPSWHTAILTTEISSHIASGRSMFIWEWSAVKEK